MGDFAGPPGLRERKKHRTRSTLIDVAVELFLQQGYEKTTVEQIAASAEVSPRTFSRYFPTKDSVIAAAADDMDGYVADALANQPLDINEHEALLRAHLQIFRPDGPVGPTPFSRMAVLIEIVNSSATLNATAFGFQRGHARRSVQVVADRMGLATDDQAVRIVADTWTSLFATAFMGMGQPGNDPVNAAILCARLESTFAVFTRTWSPWHSGEQPNR